MINLPMSDDTRKENAALLKELGVKQVTYRQKRERVLKRSDGYDSDLERDWDMELTARGVTHILHPFTFHLPGGVDYTPDFIAWTKTVDGTPWNNVIVYECKGSNKAKNVRDSYTRFRIAAGLHPYARFVWVTRTPEGEWIEQEYRP